MIQRIATHLLALVFLALALVLLALPASAQDAFDPHGAVLTPANVADWPATTAITRLAIAPTGFDIDFGAKASWPDVVPPGWAGPIEYTIWIGAQVGGQWHLAAALNVWRADPALTPGGPVTDPAHYPKNLWYLDSALGGHTPAVGEPIAFMVTAGAQRGLDAHKVAERSRIVVVPMPAAGGAAYTFPADPPVVTPPGPPVDTNPPAPPVTPPAPAFDPAPLLTRLDALEARVAALDVSVGTITALQVRVTALEARPVVTTCTAAINVGVRVPISCVLK